VAQEQSHHEDNSPFMVESGEEERHSEAILTVLPLHILLRRWNNDLYVSLFLRFHPPTCEVVKMMIYTVSFRHIWPIGCIMGWFRAFLGPFVSPILLHSLFWIKKLQKKSQVFSSLGRFMEIENINL
jgi:hypothetical protein